MGGGGGGGVDGGGDDDERPSVAGERRVKRGAFGHFKTLRLATLLSVERPCDRAEALGILEALFNHFAPGSAPQGNVGRCTDEEIAAGCGSSRDAHTLVRALVAAGWLDEHPEHRLLIHDWADHADEAVRKWLVRNKLRFLTPSGSRRAGVEIASRRRRDGIRPPRAGNGSGKGNGSGSLSVSESGSIARAREESFAAFWAAYPNKVDKQEARELWTKLAPEAALVEQIMAGLARSKTSRQWVKDGGQFIPSPAKWLRRRKWTDEGATLPLVSESFTQSAAAVRRFVERGPR